MSHALLQRFVLSVRRHELWNADARLMVAVSGGLDSLVLLDLLVATKGLLGGILSVCCVDHGVRGEEGKADLVLVSGVCHQYDVPFHPVTLMNESTDEATLRVKRYAALQDVAGDALILTAHHADDQFETMLINLVRGSGPKGLAGIPRRRANIVRPLLDFSRAELADWAIYRSLVWREDETNLTLKYLRYKIRSLVIPELKGIQPNITSGITRLTEQLREDEAALQGLLAMSDGWDEKTKSWPTDWLRQNPAAIVRRSLLKHIQGVEHRHIDAILITARQGKGRVALSGGRCVLVSLEMTVVKSE